MENQNFDLELLEQIRDLRKKFQEHPLVLAGKADWRDPSNPGRLGRKEESGENLNQPPGDTNVIFVEFDDQYPPDYRGLLDAIGLCFARLTMEERAIVVIETNEEMIEGLEATGGASEAFKEIQTLEAARNFLPHNKFQVRIDNLIPRLRAISPEAQEHLRFLEKEKWMKT